MPWSYIHLRLHLSLLQLLLDKHEQDNSENKNQQFNISKTKIIPTPAKNFTLRTILNGVHPHHSPHRSLCFAAQTHSCTCSSRSGSILLPCSRSSISYLETGEIIFHASV